MKQYILRTLLALFLLLYVSPAFAQAAYPQLNGAVADGTGALSVPDVQSAADRLARQAGATVIALAIRDKRGMTLDNYVGGFLETNGLGNPNNKSLKPNVIALVAELNGTQVNITTWYGGNFIQALDTRVQTIQTQISQNAKNLSDVFVIGFDLIGQAVYSFRNPPAPPVINQTVDTSGVGSSILTIFIYLVLIVGAGAGLYFGITKGLPLLKGQTSLTTRALKLRREVNDGLNNLFANLPMEPEKNPNMGILLLYASNPDELRKQYTQRQGKLVPLQEEAERLNDLPVDNTVEQGNLTNLIASYEGLLGKIQEIQSWLQSIDEQSTQQASQHATA